jgi:hypothetical protein
MPTIGIACCLLLVDSRIVASNGKRTSKELELDGLPVVPVPILV